MATAVAVLGATLAWAALDLRARVQAQIVQRDGEILDAVTVMQHTNDLAGGATIASLSDPGEQLDLALKVSRLRHVLGVRLYSNDGKFVTAFPAYITESALPASDLTPLRDLQPVSYFSPKARMEEQTLLAENDSPTAPLLFVEVPLRGDDHGTLAGVIQFVMDGSGIVRQDAELDRNLAVKFGAAFVVAAGLLVTGLGLALRRVQRANQKLAERTRSLLQANRELALAARTSAVGAVASHLIHGLKNPLSGLRSFVHSHEAEGSPGSDTEWRTARRTAQRMEELINRVVRVLQEQQTGAEYEISTAELAGMLNQKAGILAESAGVRFQTKVLFDAVLLNREADLILLILENLVQNGIEATPPGKSVEVSVAGHVGNILFEVRDQGPGLPPGMAGRLFLPCTSGKSGGGGIGLAISQQLAKSLGATLELLQSDATGCFFRLSVPQPRPDAIQDAGIGEFSAAAPPH
jgi:signal transduction histidine kinase